MKINIDFKSSLRLMTILIFTTFQIPLQYFSLFLKYPLPDGAPLWIRQFIIISSFIYVAIEILEYKKWNYQYKSKAIPFILFLVRILFVFIIIIVGNYSPENSILNLFMILLAFYSYGAFKFPIGLIFTILLSGAFLIHGLYDVYQSDSQLPVLVTTYRSLIMILFYLFAYFWTKDKEYSDQNRKLLNELNKSEHNLREYARRVGQTAALEERTRLARDIHDSVGHALTAIQIQLSKADAYFNLNVDESKKAVKEAKKTAQDAMSDVRESLNMLNSNKNINFSVETEIKPLIQSLKAAGNDVNVNIEGDSSQYNYAVLITLFRVIQEGITNILKHAGKCSVSLNLSFSTDNLTCILKDNGKGFDFPITSLEGHFGLDGLQNRVATVRGSLTIDSKIGEGSTLKCILPKDPVNLIGKNNE